MINNDNIKIKPLTVAQMIISVDRLTRFKPTEDKYLRVFRELISSNIIKPKFKKFEIEKLDYDDITQFVNLIFEFSLDKLNLCKKTDYAINKKLSDYEKRTFYFDKNVEYLLNNKINYDAILTLLKKDLPCNLKWLKHIKSTESCEKFSTKFPLNKIIIAEGITEEILLPIFAKKYGIDFNKKGILIISAGGKNQVVKLFYKYADILKLPVFVLLDADAKTNLEEIKPKLRKFDKIHLLNGEFEDLLAINLIKRTINKHYKNYFSISKEDLIQDAPMTKILEQLYKVHGLEFKKAEFAQLIAQNVKISDLTKDLKNIFENI